MTFKQQSKLKAVTFSYDDGITQDIRLIELLNKYNLKCTFNLNSQLLGHKGILIRDGGLRVSHYKLHPEDVSELYQGHEVAAHALTHKKLTLLEDDREIVEQVEQDRQNLSALVGYDVVGMAYPHGLYDDRVVDLLKQHTKIQYARTPPIPTALIPRRICCACVQTHFTCPLTS